MAEITINVVGPVGSGKSALCGEIEILCRALGLAVKWEQGAQEKNLTGADWTTALDLYRPTVRIVELAAAPTQEGPAASAPVEPTLRWCAHCGEGVTNFCRGKTADCPFHFPGRTAPA